MVYDFLCLHTGGYRLPFVQRFPGGYAVALYVSSQMRRVNVPPIVARAMADFLNDHVTEARGRGVSHAEVQRLQIMDDPRALQRLRTRLTETLGNGPFDDLLGSFLEALLPHLSVVGNDWVRQVVEKGQGFAIGVSVKTRKAIDFQPAPPRVYQHQLDSIVDLFYIVYAILSRSFLEEFPIANDTPARHHRRS